ncbi:hypothetical protein DFH11DRAFT_978661 [Phellopilus nigrolimitatus]|nr:hypothetical protein DFH11DRAFT_978661 [Phellopilus nigrolimitatus]
MAPAIQYISSSLNLRIHSLLSICRGIQRMHSRRSAIQSIDPNDVPTFVLQTDLVIYCQLAVVTVLVYDTIITMDKEVKYFWRSSRNCVSLIYFLNRYIGLFSAFVYLLCKSDERKIGASNDLIQFILTMQMRHCNFTFWASDLADWMTVQFITYILYTRVMALFSYDKKLAICLRSMFAMEAAFTLGILVYIILLEKMLVGSLAKGVNICFFNPVPVVWEALLWTSVVIFELVLMVLALYRAADYWRASAGLQGYILVKVVIQDQAFYFILIYYILRNNWKCHSSLCPRKPDDVSLERSR